MIWSKPYPQKVGLLVDFKGISKKWTIRCIWNDSL